MYNFIVSKSDFKQRYTLFKLFDVFSTLTIFINAYLLAKDARVCLSDFLVFYTCHVIGLVLSIATQYEEAFIMCVLFLDYSLLFL